jgi:anti-anti-sigma factor
MSTNGEWGAVMGWRRFEGPGCSVVEVEGDLDASSCVEFSKFLFSAAEDAAQRGEALRIDLTGLRQISSHGLNALARVWRDAGDDVRITLTCPKGSVREILTISRMDELFRVES